MNSDKFLKIEVSAPGKVILHGEHSVVYGKPALAGAIGERNYLEFQENSTSKLEFRFDSLDFDFEIDIRQLNNLLSSLKTNKEPTNSSGSCTTDHSWILEQIKHFIKQLDHRTINEDRKEKTLISGFYVLAGILLDQKITSLKTGFKLKLSSKLSIGAGLGSSASFGVCLAAAFYIFSKHENDPNSANESLSHSNLEYISQWAFNSEKVQHGSPSGVDNTICTFGHIVKFCKGETPIPLNFRTTLNILLVDSKVNRSTATLVAKVRGLNEEFPELAEHILDAMEEVVEQACVAYESISLYECDEFDKIEKLFQINNDLLKALGVSHPKLEIIFAIADKHGFSSKLTGAGGGGYAIVLLPDDYKEEKFGHFQKLCNELNDNGFEWFETTIGGNGLEVKFL